MVNLVSTHGQPGFNPWSTWFQPMVNLVSTHGQPGFNPWSTWFQPMVNLVSTHLSAANHWTNIAAKYRESPQTSGNLHEQSEMASCQGRREHAGHAQRPDRLLADLGGLVEHGRNDEGVQELEQGGVDHVRRLLSGSKRETAAFEDGRQCFFHHDQALYESSGVALENSLV